MPIKLFRATVTIYFPPGEMAGDAGYIADPYWPELLEVINIQKESGMNRARSEAKREAALQEYLRRNSITQEQYENLQEAARRPFYTDDEGQIIIPRHQMYGCLIAAAHTVSAGLRPCDPDNLRHLIRLSNFPTGKKLPDGISKRLIMPKSGTGQPLSNQRALRTNAYIHDFSATGTLQYAQDDLQKADELPNFFEFAGHKCGVGAARKMGFGRFIVQDYHVEQMT